MPFEDLFRALSLYYYVSDTEKEALRSAYTEKQYSTGQTLQAAEHLADQRWFLAKGWVPGYFMAGEESCTCLFAGPNNFVCSPTGFQSHAPALETLVASTDLFTLTISYTGLEALKSEFSGIARIERIIQARQQRSDQQRIRSLLTDTAAEKVKNVLREFPKLLTMALHQKVASYLGMSLRTFDYALAAHYRIPV